MHEASSAVPNFRGRTKKVSSRQGPTSNRPTARARSPGLAPCPIGAIGTTLLDPSVPSLEITYRHTGAFVHFPAKFYGMVVVSSGAGTPHWNVRDYFY